jgi:hypothetical protein
MASEEPRWDVLIGYRSPSWWTENDERGENYLQVTSGDTKRPPLTSESIDWDELGMTPRWLGEDTSECVAAIQPKNVLNRGSAEWARFLNGAQQRSEIALVISMVGGSEERSGLFGGPTAHVDLPAAMFSSVGVSASHWRRLLRLRTDWGQQIAILRCEWRTSANAIPRRTGGRCA